MTSDATPAAASQDDRPRSGGTLRAGIAGSGPGAGHLRRVLVGEIVDGFKSVMREPATLFFLAAMPVGFFALFVIVWGDEPVGGVTAAMSMLATFGTFGVVGAMLLAPGIGVAEEREQGWLRVKRVSATPLPVLLAARVVAAVPHAVMVLVAMSLVAAVSGSLQLDGGSWLRLSVVLVLGAVPFALLGLAVGLVASPNTTNAVLMAAFIPSAVISGLWMPLETLPDVLQRIAPVLPTYHLAQLGLAQMPGSAASVAMHAAALCLFTVLGAGLAGLAYRRARP